MAKHISLGQKGEKIAENYLINKGHEILEKNYRFDNAEIDIISKSNDIIVFTEVKTRTNSKNGNPENAVNHKKQHQIAKAANHFIEKKQLNCDIRFDIISIIKNTTIEKVFHIEDAFFPIS